VEVPGAHKVLMDRWKSNTFDISQAGKPQSMFDITSSYITVYAKQRPDDIQIETFIKAHSGWVAEAFAICAPRDAKGMS
jgi:hypothetical protein